MNKKTLLIAAIALSTLFIPAVAAQDTGNDDLADFSYDSNYNQTVLYGGETLDSIVNVTYTRNQSTVEETKVQFIISTTDAEGQQVSYFVDAGEFNASNMSVGESRSKSFDFRLNYLSSAQYNATLASGGNIALQTQVLEYQNVPNDFEIVTSAEYLEMNAKEDVGTFARMGLNLLNWFDNIIISPIVNLFEGILDGISSLIDDATLLLADILGAIGDWIVSVVSAIIYAIIALINIITTITGYLVTGLVNTFQFLVFFHIQHPIVPEEVAANSSQSIEPSDVVQLNETDYEKWFNGGYRIVSTYNQTGEFDSPYGVDESEKTLLTYGNDVTLFRYNFETLGSLINSTTDSSESVSYGLTDNERIHEVRFDNTFTFDGDTFYSDYANDSYAMGDSGDGIASYGNTTGKFESEAVVIPAGESIRLLDRDTPNATVSGYNQGSNFETGISEDYTISYWLDMPQASSLGAGEYPYDITWGGQSPTSQYVAYTDLSMYFADYSANESYGFIYDIYDSSLGGYCIGYVEYERTQWNGELKNQIIKKEAATASNISCSDYSISIDGKETELAPYDSYNFSGSAPPSADVSNLVGGEAFPQFRSYATSSTNGYDVVIDEFNVFDKPIPSSEYGNLEEAGGDFVSVISLKIPKAFDPVGIPIFSIALINFILVLVAAVFDIIPDPLVDAFSAILGFAGALLDTAVLALELGVWFFNWIFTVGVENLKNVLIMVGAFIGLNYVSELADAYHGRKSYVTAINNIIDDALSKIETIERSSYRAFHTLTQLGDLFFELKKMLVEIYNTLKSHIPFVG